MNPDSRVKLSAERDAFGLARAALDWHLTDLDIHTMRTAVTSFAARMAAQNMGRTRIKDWLLAPEVRVPDTSEDEVGASITCARPACPPIPVTGWSTRIAPCMA